MPRPAVAATEVGEALAVDELLARWWVAQGVFFGELPLISYYGVNVLVYKKLPPGVLDGRRKHRHFQFLTEGVGHPHLEKHVAVVTSLMKAAETWTDFERMVARNFPPTVTASAELVASKTESSQDTGASKKAR